MLEARTCGRGRAHSHADSESRLTLFRARVQTGFVLGTIRTRWVVPGVGTRTAELLETPIMLVVMALAAGWTVPRLGVPRASSARLATGGIALFLMLVAEFGLMLWIQGLSI
jgi:hypothetical protein